MFSGTNICKGSKDLSEVHVLLSRSSRLIRDCEQIWNTVNCNVTYHEWNIANKLFRDLSRIANWELHRPICHSLNTDYCVVIYVTI